jgi:hypothetical protein
MTSPAQIEANRDNAAHSTGPKSPGGKARSSRNAVRHGLRSELPVLPGEQAGDWHRHREGVLRSLAPVGTLEQELAERVALCLWRLRRVAAFETATATALIEGVEDDTRRQMEGEGVPLGEPGDARALSKVERKLAAVREELTDGDGGLAALEGILRGGDDAVPVDGWAARTIFEWANEILPEGKYVELDDDDRFLIRLGVPVDELDENWVWAGWTAGVVCKGLTNMGVPDNLRERLVTEGQRFVARKRQETSALEKQAQTLRRRVRVLEQRKRQQRVLPDESTMNKVMRYEAHVSRQMLQALHTLERLQAARAGADVPPPAALDVTLNGESPALEAVLENAGT